MCKTLWLAGLVSIISLVVLVTPSFGQVEIEVGVPSSEALEVLDAFNWQLVELYGEEICEYVELLDADSLARLCIWYDFTTPYFAAHISISSTTESRKIINVIFEDEILSRSFTVNSDTLNTIITDLSAGSYEVLVYQAEPELDDPESAKGSFRFEIEPVVAVAQQPDVVEYTVTSTRAPLRDRPGVSTEIVEIVANGDTLYIYDEEQEHEGWLRVWREGKDDVWIVDTVVKKASQAFYPLSQEPLVSASGRGNTITEIFEIPAGLYRIDAEIDDNSFYLDAITIDGTCRDQSVFSVINIVNSKLAISGLYISRGCSVVFQSTRVSGNWQIELRELLDPNGMPVSLLEIEDATSISGKGPSLTMATRLPRGIWSLSAIVQESYFRLHPHVLSGGCDDSTVINESSSDEEPLKIRTVYRVTSAAACVIYWETGYVDGEWELTFEKLR